MKRIHIVGRKNSGKTTLIVELVTRLSSLGYRVGTVKHTHHRHELDTPGKDSYRHRQAGAVAVGILSPALSAVFWPTSPDDGLASRYAALFSAFPECDLALVEGDLKCEGLKIEVWRTETQQEPIASTNRSIRAVVTDDPVDVAIPVWSRSDMDALVTRLRELVATA